MFCFNNKVQRILKIFSFSCTFQNRTMTTSVSESNVTRQQIQNHTGFIPESGIPESGSEIV